TGSDKIPSPGGRLTTDSVYLEPSRFQGGQPGARCRRTTFEQRPIARARPSVSVTNDGTNVCSRFRWDTSPSRPERNDTAQVKLGQQPQRPQPRSESCPENLFDRGASVDSRQQEGRPNFQPNVAELLRANGKMRDARHISEP